jgi:hypothetical protein
MPTAHPNPWFPGRTIGGTTLILGPLIWCLGWTLRYIPTRLHLFTPAQQHDFDTRQFAGPMLLATYHKIPTLMTLAFACFLLGSLLLIPATTTLAHLATPRAPHLATWGATLLIAGLFARAYFAGVDQTAFQLTEQLGVKATTTAIMNSYMDISYGPWRVAVWCSVGQYLGTLLLAIAAYKSRTIGTARLILLLASGATWMGVLKDAGTHDDTFGIPIEPVLLCIVLIPLGIRVLRNRAVDLQPTTRDEPLGRRKLLSW